MIRISPQEPGIDTARLWLRETNPDNTRQVLLEEDKAAAMHFLGLQTQEDYEEALKNLAKGMESAWASFRLWKLVLKDNGEVIGNCGFHNWAKKHNRAELGYWMLTDTYKRQGLMKEALIEVIRAGFGEMGLWRIYANISPTNEPSQRLVKHHGFQKEGYMRQDYVRPDGVTDDSEMWALLKNEWRFR
ncbi:GNAT family protein [Pontibacter sp. G13]|uniref:GNAT family N-acetyltransferase n=1 Tax=Pontibacter sp. G13 TaxID=3074898 RepID=UPI0028890ED0|nr:GNAT family protein [Pontibacter sp. G13]WNJ20893.1 GNAT family protein [Pontibacter sp. G13]